MKVIKKVIIIVSCVVLLCVPFSVNAFAVDPVVFSEAETLGATIVDLYGAYNNTSLAYESINSSGALTEVITLYQNYSSSASDPYTLAAIGAAAAVSGAIAVIYDAVTGQGYIQLYQEQFISSLDGYWDYQLADAGLIRDAVTGFFNWTVDQNDVPIPIVIATSGGYFPNSPLNTISSPSANSTTFDLSTPVGRFWSGAYYYNNAYFLVTNTVSYLCLVPSTSNPTTIYQLIALSDSSSPSFRPIDYNESNGNYTLGSANSGSNVGSNNGWYIRRLGNLSISSATDWYLHIFSTTDEAITTLNGLRNGTIPDIDESVSIEPSIYIGDPLQNPVEISIPDVSNPNYAPQPTRITTTIPWNPDWGNPLPDGVDTPEYGVPYPITDPEILNEAVPDIWDSIVADGVEIQDAPEPVEPAPNPSEVYIPFLPVTLPSFNFSLSGIWHYVTAWIASLGDWFTLVFTTWSYLPYAISVPVYATAVIVIVLGVYRRFFM